MILSFVSSHWLVWLTVFGLTFLLTLIGGNNPLVSSNTHCEEAIRKNRWKILPLIVMVCSEYLFFAAVIIMAVRASG